MQRLHGTRGITVSQMKRLEIAVCDDDFIAGSVIADMVKASVYCDECQTFASGEMLLKTIRDEGMSFDTVLLDIEWNGIECGIKIAREISRVSPRTCIIYVTGYAQKYVQEVFLSEANLRGFLTKPVDPDLLGRNLQRIYKDKEEHESKLFTFVQNRIKHTVCFDEIVYLESEGHRIKIFTNIGKYESYGKLDDVSMHFPNNFIRCHKSYLVNMFYIDKIQSKNHFLILKNEENTHIPISKMSYPIFRKRFYEYRMNSFREEVGRQ